MFLCAYVVKKSCVFNPTVQECDATKDSQRTNARPIIVFVFLYSQFLITNSFPLSSTVNIRYYQIQRAHDGNKVADLITFCHVVER